MKKKEAEKRIEVLEDRVEELSIALEMLGLERSFKSKIQPPMPWPDPPDCEVEA